MYGQRQVRGDDGEEDRRTHLRASRRPDGGQAQDDHDHLRLPHARRHVLGEEGHAKVTFNLLTTG